MNPEKSIAVLPFSNLSVDGDNEYFCDGITEEIIYALAKIDGLKVISRTSSFHFKNHQSPLKEVAEKLQVSMLIEGSVKVGGDTLRIKTQLIEAQSDEVLWSHSWDRKKDNLFEVQDEISLLIADTLREHVGHLTISESLVEKSTGSLVAYEKLLKGNYHFYKWNPEDTNTSIELFEQAVTLDPNLIEGHLGLADSYSFLAVSGFAPREASWMKAMEAIETAKKIDPKNAKLNYMLSHQAFFTEANFSSALQYAHQAVATKPTYSEAHQMLSTLYSLRSDFEQASEHIHFAKSVDPLNAEALFFEANLAYRIGEYDKALDILGGLLEANEKNLPAILVSIYIFIKTQNLDEARRVMQQTPKETFTPDEHLGLSILIEAQSGNKHPEGLTELEQHAQNPASHHAHAYLFIIYAVLGKNDQAFEILEHLFRSNSSILLLTFSDPMADEICNDERYGEYHARIYRVSESASKTQKPSKKERDVQVDQKQVEKLEDYMESERPYLNPTLSLRSLAEQIEIHPNQLSFLLNESVGKNFNEFINLRRIEHFKNLILDPGNSHISIIGLAYESGFNSKTVFNTAFKKEVGMTPKEFQKSHQSG